MLRNYITAFVIVGALIVPTHAQAIEPFEIIKRLIQLNNINNNLDRLNISQELEKIAIKTVENYPKKRDRNKVDNR
jgi:hypothetical protein